VPVWVSSANQLGRVADAVDGDVGDEQTQEPTHLALVEARQASAHGLEAEENHEREAQVPDQAADQLEGVAEDQDELAAHLGPEQHRNVHARAPSATTRR